MSLRGPLHPWTAGLKVSKDIKQMYIASIFHLGMLPEPYLQYKTHHRLDRWLFTSPTEGRVVINRWLDEYNTVSLILLD